MKTREIKFQKMIMAALLGALLFISCAGCANLGQAPAPAPSGDQLSAALSGLSVLKPELAPKIAAVQKALKYAQAAKEPADPLSDVPVVMTPRYKGAPCSAEDWSVTLTREKVVTGMAAFEAVNPGAVSSGTNSSEDVNSSLADSDDALADSLASLFESLQKDAASKASE